jgi:hypothetical protein
LSHQISLSNHEEGRSEATLCKVKILPNSIILDEQEEEGGEQEKPPKRHHGKCVEGYSFGNVFSSCWYIKFLSPDRDGVEGTCSRTRRQSGKDRQSIFRALFRLPLDKVERLEDLMMEHQIIHPTLRMKSPLAKAELHVMGALCVLYHVLNMEHTMIRR